MTITGKRTQRRYAPEEKENAVRLVRLRRPETGERHGSVKAVADQLGYGVESVRARVKQADIDDGLTAGTPEPDRVAPRLARVGWPRRHRTAHLEPRSPAQQVQRCAHHRG